MKRRELAEFMSTQGVKNGAKANSAAGNVIIFIIQLYHLSFIFNL